MTGKNWQGPIEIDESSGQRQLQISVPVLDGGKPDRLARRRHCPEHARTVIRTRRNRPSRDGCARVDSRSAP